MTFAFQGYWDLLRRYLRPQFRLFVLLGVLLFSALALQLVHPQLVRVFIDTAMTQGSLQTLTILALLFLAMAVLTQIVMVAEAYVAEHLGVTASNQLRADLLAHCLALDPAFHSAHAPGELTERIDSEVAALSNFFSRFLIQVLGNALLLLAILVLSFGIHWRIGLSLSLFSVLTVLVLDRLRNAGVQPWTEVGAAHAEMAGFLEERLSGLDDMRANGASDYIMRRMAERAVRQLRAVRRAMLIGVSSMSGPMILLALALAVALGLGGYLYQQGQVTLGELYLIVAYVELLRQPVEQLAREFRDVQEATASMLRIQQLMHTPRTVCDGTAGTLPASGSLALSFDHVTFQYSEEGAPVLHDLTFALPAGQKLGLLGRTGSGKTTITRLLFRLYDPAQGVVRLDGVDLRDLPLAVVRGRIGMVTQDIQLFHASVRDNLTFFDRAIPDEHIVAVLDELGLQHWYQALPQGLDTWLAPDSSGLSAGEAQLLAFARVFLHDPSVVILDEASSRLDPATEQTLEHAIDRLLHGRTALIIAHRLTTVQRTDTILILEQGRIAEYGERSRLAHDPSSRSARLLQLGLEDTLL